MSNNTGTARANSTMAPETVRMIRLGSSRPMPKTRPNATAPITASMVARTVAHRPGR